MVDAITIRQSTSADERRINRLAALDSAEAPAGDLLLAEVGGELVAAVAADGRAVADPFVPSADVVGLLRHMVDGRPSWRRRLAL
jgi:hypothetical protein